MVDPWFDPIHYAYLPGTIFGVTVGLWGGLFGVFHFYRQFYSWLFYSGWALLLFAIAMLMLGVFALSTGQPYGIWYGLLLPGIQGTIMMPFFLWMVRWRRRENELRTIAAEDVRAMN